MSIQDVSSRVEGDRVLILERNFGAPRDLVFNMFKEPEHLKHWWGPVGWELPFCEIDFRPGGTWHYCMKCMDRNQGEYYGMLSCGRAIYKDIIEPEMIAYTDYFADKDGNIDEALPASEIVVEFIDLGEETKLVNRVEYASAKGLKTVLDMGMLEGISQTWDRLEERLAKVK